MSNKLNDDLIFMIECATQAPSGYNTQPWIFEINHETLFILPDFARRLPVVDADDRELFISLGCATENLCLAAAKRGYATQVKVNGEKIAVHLLKTNTAEESPLFNSISQRQANRLIYDGREIPAAILSPILQQSIQENAVDISAWGRQSREFEQLTQYVMDGNTAQMHDAAFKAELLSWIRFNKKQAEQTRDGLSYAALGAPNLPAWISRPIV